VKRPGEAVGRIGQRLVLRTSRTPLRALWRPLHEAAVRLVVAFLRRGHPGAAAYACGGFGSGDPLYGISDLDLAIVLPDPPGEPGANRATVLERWRKLTARLPLAEGFVDLAVHEDAGLRLAAAATTFTFGLDRPRGEEPSLYHGPGRVPRIGGAPLVHGPGIYGPTSGWRLLSGPDRLPPRPTYEGQDRRIAAWLQVQSWWRWTFAAALEPSAPWIPYLCVKLVSEPLRILLLLERGEVHFDRAAPLRRALESMPEHAAAAERALELYRRLHRSPRAPLGEALADFVPLCSRIATVITNDAMAAGATAVKLEGDPEDVVLPNAGSARDLLPLADWHTLVLSPRHDEALAISGCDPRDPGALAAAARGEDGSRYVALRAEGLLVLPVKELWERGRLRAAQCAATDPVSFALLDGERISRFPNARGWSAEDWARRAVAERRGWIEQGRGSPADPGEALGRLLAAARAALFLDSLGTGDPMLPLSVSVAARMLADRRPERRAVIEEGLDGYRRWREEGEEPPGPAVEGLLEVVSSLPPYARSRVPRLRAAGRSRPRSSRESIGAAHMYLTFDDGPDPVWTPRVLDALERADANASFFVTASRAKAEPALVREIAARGHTIELHCLRHVRQTCLGRGEAQADTRAALELLGELGQRPSRWRPPFGACAAWTADVAAEAGLTLTGWSADPADWRGDPADRMLAGVRSWLRDGAVVVMHDAVGPGAVRADCAETVRLIEPLAELIRSLDAAPAALPRPGSENGSLVYAPLPFVESLG
jgi:peptidoglycan-N-acetylglucosamine deacetylase